MKMKSSFVMLVMVFVACGHFGISNAAPQRTFRRTFSNSNNRRSSFSSGRRSFTRNGGSRTFIRSGRAFGTTGGGSSFSSNSASATLPNSATSFSSSSSSSSSGQLFPSNVPSGILSTGGTILGGLIRNTNPTKVENSLRTVGRFLSNLPPFPRIDQSAAANLVENKAIFLDQNLNDIFALANSFLASLTNKQTASQATSASG